MSLKYILFFLLFVYLAPSNAQIINGSNVPTDELITTYWDAKNKKMRSRGKYNYAGFSGIGKQDGKWEFWYENGKQEEVANYSKGKLQGKVTKYWQNGKKMHEGYFKQDVIDSTMKSWYENGKIHESGTYSLGKKTGIWKYYDLSGKPTHQEKHLDGKIYLINFWNHKDEQTVENGNGTKIEYYSTLETEKVKPIIKLEYTYKNGLENGPFVEYNPLGKVLAQGNYKEGLKDGDWLFSFSDGILYKKVSYTED